jgi:integrase
VLDADKASCSPGFKNGQTRSRTDGVRAADRSTTRLTDPVTCVFWSERATGIEPAPPAWKNYLTYWYYLRFPSRGALEQLFYVTGNAGSSQLLPACSRTIAHAVTGAPYAILPMPTSRRHFGSVRKLPSGRYQASYYHLGQRRTASSTLGTKADALAWLASVETDIFRGQWVDPGAGKVTFGHYADTWLAQRYELRPRTIELYHSILSKHLRPAFGQAPLAQITTVTVRSWYAGVAKQSPLVAAKSYRLLRTILNTAAADGLIVASPCTLKGAGIERTAERKIPSLDVVYAIAGNVGGRYKALVLTAALAGLRLGELSALTRQHVDLVYRTITVEVQAQLVAGRGRILGPPKSKAGVRAVALPSALVMVLELHLVNHVEPEAEALVFSGEKGAPIDRSNWARRFRKAASAAGVPGLHFHDLRHVAGTLAASTGASTRELMARLGHSTTRAALIYQHATAERDHEIAARIDAILEAARRSPAGQLVRLKRPLASA